MRKRVTVAVGAAFLSIFSFAAQAAPSKGSGGPAPPTEQEQRAAARKAAEDEKAYRQGLDRIPDAKQNNDPWSKVR